MAVSFEITDRLASRFWAKVDRLGPDECWRWTGGSRGVGYGAIKIERRAYDAHRVAYLITKGEVPVGRLVMHTCDNRACCNPAHLCVGTHRDNSIDAIQKGRIVNPHRIRTVPLTDEQMRELFEKFSRGVGKLQLAREYRVPVTSMYRVLKKAEKLVGCK